MTGVERLGKDEFNFQHSSSGDYEMHFTILPFTHLGGASLTVFPNKMTFRLFFRIPVRLGGGHFFLTRSAKFKVNRNDS